MLKVPTRSVESIPSVEAPPVVVPMAAKPVCVPACVPLGPPKRMLLVGVVSLGTKYTAKLPAVGAKVPLVAVLYRFRLRLFTCDAPEPTQRRWPGHRYCRNWNSHCTNSDRFPLACNCYTDRYIRYSCRLHWPGYWPLATLGFRAARRQLRNLSFVLPRTNGDFSSECTDRKNVRMDALRF